MADHSLTAELVLREAWDAASGSLKTVPGSSTQFEIELSAADGDSVNVQGEQKNAPVANITNASTGIVVPELDASSMKSFQIYVKTTTAIVGPQVLTLELSPVDSGDVWLTTTCTVTPSTTLDAVVASSVLAGVARRARVRTAAAITSGVADIYLMMQGN